MNYWGMHIGRGGEFVELAKKGNFVGIGWNDLGNLSWLLKERPEYAKNKLVKLYNKNYSGSEWRAKRGSGIGQVMKFVREMKKGDIVFVPNMINRQILVGKIISGYLFARKKDGCKYKNRRKVKWLKEVAWDQVSSPLRHSLGSLLSIFKMKRCNNELRSIVEGKKNTTNTPLYKQINDEKSIVGDIINFRGLIFAPVNEQGVVFLFGKVSKDLGIEIEEIQQGFPDATGRVRTPKGLAKRTIEFEYRSSNYKNHLPNKANLLICWEDDWSDCPKDIHVIELKSVIKDLEDKE